MAHLGSRECLALNSYGSVIGRPIWDLLSARQGQAGDRCRHTDKQIISLQIRYGPRLRHAERIPNGLRSRPRPTEITVIHVWDRSDHDRDLIMRL